MIMIPNQVHLLLTTLWPAMDPLSITASCLTLVGTITKLSTTLIVFVKSVRGARSDLDTISRELHSLQTVLELLAEDASDSSKNHFPPTLQKQIEGIISNCGQVLAEIERTLEKYKGYGASKGARWAVSGSDDVTKLRISLEAHKSALEIALEMVAMYVKFKLRKQIPC